MKYEETACLYKHSKIQDNHFRLIYVLNIWKIKMAEKTVGIHSFAFKQCIEIYWRSNSGKSINQMYKAGETVTK